MLPDAELEKLSLGHLAVASKNLFAAVEVIGGAPTPTPRVPMNETDSDSLSGHTLPQAIAS